jgi:hypothetical protein
MRAGGRPDDLRTDLFVPGATARTFANLASFTRPGTSEEFWRLSAELATNDDDRDRFNGRAERVARARLQKKT